jgi:SpoIID/LytB domain protein
MALRASVLTIGLVMLGALAPLAPASADAPWAVPGDATVTVDGLGFGHGRGLSQYGALARGRAGQDYRQIVDFYYPGATWGTANGIVRVLVSGDTTTDVVVDPRTGLTVRAVAGGRPVTLPTRVSGRRVTRWRIVPAAGGRSSVDALTHRWARWRLLGGDAEFGAQGQPVTLRTPSGPVAYRGALRSATPADGSGRDTVDVVGLDGYLKGVLPREVVASTWPPATLRAQAVAARTYAAYERAHVPARRHYDLCDTASCQVYGGASAEYPSTNQAVDATAGQVLTSGGTPAFTQFSASNGGWSVAGSATQPYLVAQPDPYDHYDPDGVDGDGWRTPLTSAAIERAYGIDDLTGLAVETRDGKGQWGGRAVTVRLTSAKGWTDTVTGDSFRRRLGLRSTFFTISDVAAR